MSSKLGRLLAIDPERWAESLLEVVLRAIVPLAVIVCVPSIYLALSRGLVGVAVTDTVALLGLVALLLLRQLPFRTRATLVCAIFYMVGAALLHWVGPISQIYLLAFAAVTTLLLGRRAGLYACVIATVTMLAVGALGFDPKTVEGAATYTLATWVVVTLNFAGVTTFITLTTGAVLRSLKLALARETATRIAVAADRTLLRALFDAMPDVVLTKDRNGRYTSGNPAALAFLGVASEGELRDKEVTDYFPSDVAEVYRAEDRHVLAGNLLVNQEERNTMADGREISLLTVKAPLRDAAGEVVGLVAIGRDITYRRDLEEKLRQAQKMDAFGQLAGGVAHDFNNLLTVILSYSEELATNADLPSDARDCAAQISVAGERAASLTRQLLAFSRQTVLAPQVLDINAVIVETSRMLRRIIGEQVRVETVLAPDLDHVSLDPGQLNQVLMNVAVNARDAMPRGGTLTITTSAVVVGADVVPTHMPCAPGLYVVVTMRDTGVGMPPSVLARMFEPFFTTKPVGEGTGLGLAMVFGVAQQSGGSIRVTSAPGEGTEFAIYFPAVVAPVSPRSTPASSPSVGVETILLVEDEPGVRALAARFLERAGYTVLEAASGVEALRIAVAARQPIALLLTDVVMPTMSGPELAEAMRRVRPGIKVLYMSGYSAKLSGAYGALDAGAPLLQKPFAPSELTERVRAALDSRP